MKHMLRILALAAVFLCTAHFANAQNVTFTAESTSAGTGGQVTVAVTVSGFTDVVTFQGTLQFDPAILAFAGTGDYGVAGLGAANFGAPGSGSVPADRLTFSWFESTTVNPATLAGGSVLFSVTFDVVGASGASDIAFVSSPTPMEVAVSDNGTLITAGVSTQSGQVAVTEPQVDLRVTEGLQVLYTFEETGGTVVNDVAGVGTPINLTITSGATAWTGSALDVTGESIITSGGPATRLVAALEATNAVTVEAWVVPANTTQGGPARIVALSENGYPAGGNFILGPYGTEYWGRVRTTSTDQYGTPTLIGGTVTTSMTHVMMTHASDGERRLYVDGVHVDTENVAGTFGNWGDMALALTNEPVGARAWLGALHLVAIYDRAFTPQQVLQNFDAGPDGTTEPPPPTPEYTLTVQTVGAGTVQRSPASASYTSGTEVTLTAVADAGWEFEGWSGAISGTTNPQSLVMNGDKTITATFSQLPPEPADFSGILTLTETGQPTRTLNFGTAPNASDATDPGHDAILPPPAQSGFDARFTCLEGTACEDALSTDVRETLGEGRTHVWQIDFRRVSSAADVVLDWSGTALPEGVFRLVDRDGLVDVDMKAQTSHTATQGDRLLILYTSTTAPASAVVGVDAKWNLLGLPLFAADNRVASVFPGAMANMMYAFDGDAYSLADRLHLGEGYWVYFESAGSKTVSGYNVNAVTLTLEKGWNVIAGPSCDAPVFDDPDGLIVPGTLFGLGNDQYVALTSLSQGQGAWVKSRDEGRVTLTCGGSQSVASLRVQGGNPAVTLPVRVSDGSGSAVLTVGFDASATDGFDAAYDLLAPPPPPAGVLDARIRGFDNDFFTDVRALEGEHVFQLAYQPAAGGQGLTLSWDPAVLSPEGSFVITDGAGFELDMRTSGSLNTSSRSTLRSGLAIRVRSGATVGREDDAALPESFALHGNYPNPFNPSTQVVVDLPAASHVRVEVYDLLGRLRLVAADRDMQAGAGQAVRVDAAEMESGIYVYRVVAASGGESRTLVGRMTLIK